MARLARALERLGQLYIACSFRAHAVQVSDECATTALRTVQDHLTLVIAERRAHKMLSGHTASRTKGNAVCEAMEAEAKRIYDQKAAEADTYKDATQEVIEKAEALEKHVKTETVRAKPLTMTEDNDTMRHKTT